MAITMRDQRMSDNYSFMGLSTDDKPTEDVGVNSLFWELDTNDTYYFTGENWAKVGGEAEA